MKQQARMYRLDGWRPQGDACCFCGDKNPLERVEANAPQPDHCICGGP